jgi:hypothetical protein
VAGRWPDILITLTHGLFSDDERRQIKPVRSARHVDVSYYQVDVHRRLENLYRIAQCERRLLPTADYRFRTFQLRTNLWERVSGTLGRAPIKEPNAQRINPGLVKHVRFLKGEVACAMQCSSRAGGLVARQTPCSPARAKRFSCSD